jgi:hypothetical protein
LYAWPALAARLAEIYATLVEAPTALKVAAR